jgi:hypothetical protein
VVAPGADPGGLVVEGSKKAAKLQASEGIVQSLIGLVERLWYFTLNWIAAHPLLTVALCLAVAWWRWQSHMTKVKVAGMKSDYKSARDRARVAPQSRRNVK